MKAWRKACRRQRIRWADVLTMARQLRAVEIERREPYDGARRAAWTSYCHFAGRSVGCHPFWRVGFAHVLDGLANRGRDYTAIRAYDIIAESVAADFPQWTGKCDELWEFLAEPYKRLPTLAEFMAEAMEFAAGATQEVPF